MTPDQLAWRATNYVPWYERIGDGWPLAWVTVAAYLVAAVLCALTARRVADDGGDDERALWWMAGAALLALGINKQLDLQVALIEGGRELALTYGWYGARRMVQMAVFAIVLLVLGASALWLLRRVWRQDATLKLAFAGLAVIAAYVALRLAKFQHVLWDVRGFDGPGWLPMLELGGIALVAIAAGWRRRLRGRRIDP